MIDSLQFVMCSNTSVVFIYFHNLENYLTFSVKIHCNFTFIVFCSRVTISLTFTPSAVCTSVHNGTVKTNCVIDHYVIIYDTQSYNQPYIHFLGKPNDDSTNPFVTDLPLSTNFTNYFFNKHLPIRKLWHFSAENLHFSYFLTFSTIKDLENGIGNI